MRAGAAALGLMLPTTAFGMVGGHVNMRPGARTNPVGAAAEWIADGPIDGGNITGLEANRLIGDAVSPVSDEIANLVAKYVLAPQPQIDLNQLFANRVPAPGTVQSTPNQLP